MTRFAATDYDAELRLHNRVLFEACAINQSDRVIDIGCGNGQTTLEAGRLAPKGNVLGIDIVERSIEKARAAAAAAGLQNVRFEHGDAQHYSFLSRSFDLAMSRYGTMFFSDPAAAFGNIRRGLSRGGRLVMMVWQAHEKNEWSIAIEDALGPYFLPTPRDREHFSLADVDVVNRVLEAAGFSRVAVDAVCEPVYYGPDVESALRWVQDFRFVRDVTERLDGDAVGAVLEQLRRTMTRHKRDNGVWFEAREWIVTAHNNVGWTAQ